LWLVGNKVRDEQEVLFLEQQTPDLRVLGYLPADLAVQEADRLGQAVYDYVPAVREAAERMAGKLVGEVAQTGERIS
jgi:CO dehydrogenase nickel-insertion accessory protein CooC1